MQETERRSDKGRGREKTQRERQGENERKERDLDIDKGSEQRNLERHVGRQREGPETLRERERVRESDIKG